MFVSAIVLLICKILIKREVKHRTIKYKKIFKIVFFVNSFILSRNSGTISQYIKILYIELFSLFYFYLIYFTLFIGHKIMSNTFSDSLLDYFSGRKKD
jgi:hypothetical protein